jgi:lysophospholipase L1-like esterase
MMNVGATLLTYVPYSEPELRLRNGYIRDGIIKDFMTDTAVRAYLDQIILEQGGSSSLYGLKWAVLGDSLTQGSTDKYHSYIAARTGCTILNYGIGGTKFIASSNSMSTRYTSMDDTADIITVWGGVNDSNTSNIGTMADRTNATFYGACHVLFLGLLEKYPAKRVGVITPLRTESASPKDVIVAAEIEVARYYNIPVLDMYYGGGIYPDSAVVSAAVIADKLHPDPAGHMKLSWKIQAFIEQLS